MATCTLTLHVHVARWLRLYLYGVAAISRLTGREPDMDKVGRMIERGITVSETPSKARKRGL